MNAPALPPVARLLELEAEAQELLPEHTYKAVMRLVKGWPAERQIEWLEARHAEFRRGLDP